MRHETLPPARLSRELRTGTSPDVQRRRWAIGLSFAGLVAGIAVTAYQAGIVRRLPDILPGAVFDAEKVDASDYAYKRLQTPDGAQMLVTYALTIALAAAGGEDRAQAQPALALAATAKAAFDVATCLKLAQEEWAENHKLCSWCQVATLASVATLAVLLPEAVRASENI